MPSIQSLLDTMQKLRDKESGCPWDIEQTFESLSKYLIEEAYEATDAIARKDYLNLKEELGDVLLQVIFHSQIASELELFDFNDVSDSLNKKLIRRHPYVFNGGDKPFSAKDQGRLWEAIKKEEKKNIKPSSIFGDIPSSMPPSLRSERIQKKASKKGFDWDHPDDVVTKIDEEIEELKIAIANQDKDNIEEEIGDLLFTIINLGRHLDIDTTEALARSNRKFINRFHALEEALKNTHKNIKDTSPEELEKIWVKIKSHE
jgi:ATP diphosphatase|tara:strand:+ start:807 stop:1586 length:780 start_codon:yes stop_codon:yes gene_type:complete